MEKSKLLHDEGLEIIKAFGFLELLERYGEARLVGSVALDLVVKPDLDFHLYVGEPGVVEVAGSLMGSLIAEPRIREVRITDYLDRASLKIGIDHLPGRTRDWSVDIWVTSDFSTLGFEELEEFLMLLNEENRQLILDLKRHYFEQGQLRDGLSSSIYRAVLKEGVSDLEGFQDYYQRGSGKQ